MLGGFYPDPSVIRVGETFYLVNSSFSWFPGIPVFESKNLVDWTQIGNAIDRPNQLDFGKLGMSRGVFAASIAEHDGTFYIVNTCVDCGGNFVITATNPAGPWSNPVWLPSLSDGIDPSLFFDDDGRAWIVSNGPPEGEPKYQGHRAIWLQEFSPRGLQTIGPRRVIVDGGTDISKQPIWVEGPHLFRKDGWYYLICAEGGTYEGHSEVVFRARSLAGPFVPWAGNPILTQRDLPAGRRFPITSSGHAQLVDTPGGDWWAMFLATRPYRDDFYNTGRETYLMPVRWQDGWPVVTPPATPIPYVAKRPRIAGAAPAPSGPPRHEVFAGPELAPWWVMMRQPRARWYSFDGGALVLDARRDAIGGFANPSFLARRQQHSDATVTTQLHFEPQREGDRAGLVALQNDEYWIFAGIGMQGGAPVLLAEMRQGPGQPAAGLAVRTVPLRALPKTLWLRIAAKGGTYVLSYAVAPGRWQLLASVDGTILSTKTAGGFVGTMLGVYAHRGEGK